MEPTRHLPTFDEPLEMLEACHEKIERQLGLIEKLVPHLGAHGADDAARAAAGAVIRYFDTAGAVHHRDEDEDVFPLVRAAAARDGRDEVCAALYELEREHQSMDHLWSEVKAQLEAILSGASSRLDGDLVTRFAWIYRRHMRVEADLILPYAREAIGPALRAVLGERMAARRRPALAA
jgi:pyridoxamine 5'-phosphate oxidase